MIAESFTMINLLDRYLVLSYVKAYAICLISLLGLYVVVDLFTNIDDFTGQNRSFAQVLEHIGAYYGFRVAEIFDKLCDVIVLLAAMFTVAWVQRNNELLPLLSAGVPTRRVLRPVLVCACVLLGLSVFNQELIIPQIARFLANNRDDPDGVKDRIAQPAWEPNRILIVGKTASPPEMLVRDFACTIPAELGLGRAVTLYAKEARYIPPDAEGKTRRGGWLLIGAKETDLAAWNRPDILESIDPGKYFLHTTEVDFATMTRDPKKWFYRASTPELYQELGKSDSNRLASMAVLFHSRLTRPILGLILLFLGLSVILRDQNRNVFISAGMCLGLCAIFFAICFGCKNLGDSEVLSPAFAAWLPVLLFGPLSFVLFDAIHT
jgi:lipopolysaccharide export system permease protein